MDILRLFAACMLIGAGVTFGYLLARVLTFSVINLINLWYAHKVVSKLLDKPQEKPTAPKPRCVNCKFNERKAGEMLCGTCAKGKL